MSAFKGVGHAACWDGVSLHLENNKNQRQGNRHDKPLESSKNSPGPALRRPLTFLIFPVVPTQFLPFLVADDIKTFNYALIWVFGQGGIKDFTNFEFTGADHIYVVFSTKFL